jgi:hypothetical protein
MKEMPLLSFKTLWNKHVFISTIENNAYSGNKLITASFKCDWAKLSFLIFSLCKLIKLKCPVTI